MTRTLASLLGLALLACGGATPEAEEPPDHAAGHPGARAGHHRHHGPGHQHDFSDVERFAAIFDAPDRDAWQRPADVVALMAIEPGMTVVDLGAGTGYFLPYLRDAVGDDGCVVALDVEPNMVAHMEARIAEAGWDNVVARAVAPDDPGLPAGSTDRVLVVDTWHHLGDREAYAARLAEGLRGPTPGTLTIVDFTRDAPRGPPPAMRLDAEAVLGELGPAGFEAAVLDEALPHQWVIGARARAGDAARVGSLCD